MGKGRKRGKEGAGEGEGVVVRAGREGVVVVAKGDKRGWREERAGGHVSLRAH